MCLKTVSVCFIGDVENTFLPLLKFSSGVPLQSTAAVDIVLCDTVHGCSRVKLNAVQDLRTEWVGIMQCKS